jgi:hypothetical protein
MSRLPNRDIFQLVIGDGAEPDGSEQSELANSQPGEPVRLRLERNSPSQTTTIAVLSRRDKILGRLAGMDAEEIAPLLGGGRPYAAKLHRLIGGIPDAPHYRAEISIVWSGRPARTHIPLSAEQVAYRAGHPCVDGGERHTDNGRTGRDRAGCASALATGLFLAAAFIFLAGLPT